jgi:hypothetical protein
MLSDALHSYGDDIEEETLRVLASGTLSKAHGQAFTAYVKTVRHRFDLDAVLKGEVGWPARPEDRDLLYYLAETFRARLVHDLPADKDRAPARMREFAHRAKSLLVELAEISLECAQLVIATDEHGVAVLPAWFMVDIGRDLPRLVAART